MNRLNEKGQSIVEAALFLPILIFILAGVVEVGNLMNTQNRVTTASRVAAGFGASNFNPNDWSNTADAMGDVALNTVTETLDLSPDLWDIWSLHAITNEDGTGFNVFTHTQVFGNNTVVTAGEWTGMVQDIQTDVLNSLQSECSGGPACAADIEVVASVPFHNIDSILGLPIWQWTGFNTIRGLTVMRVGQRPESVGCPLLPITIRLDQYSLYPTNWPCGYGDTSCDVNEWRLQQNKSYPWYLSDPVVRFPDSFGSQMSDPPTYDNIVAPIGPMDLSTDNYGYNIPGVPLDAARGKVGYIYWAREEVGTGQFGWLTWRGSPSETALDNSLSADLTTFPPILGNFMDPDEGYRGSPADMNTISNNGFGDTGDTDGKLEIGEWVEGTTGNINVARDWMQEYIDQGIKPNLIVYDYDNGDTGSSLNYHVYNFAKVEILGYKFQGTEKWIVFRIVQFPSSECIYKEAYPGP